MKRIAIIFGIAAATLISCTKQQSPDNRLMQDAFAKINPETFQPGKRYFFYPEYSDRAAWQNLLGEDAEEIIKTGESLLDYQWEVIPATAYLEFQRGGNRAVMQTPNSRNSSALSRLVYAELAEGKGRFIDKIVDGMWVFSERASWVLSAHQVRQHSKKALPDYRDVIMDLGSQQIGEVYSLALYFFRDKFDAIDPVLSATFDEALQRNLFRPYLNPDNRAAQSWLGYPAPETGDVVWWESWDPRNNWNVWCNSAVAHSALLACRDKDQLYAILKQSAESIDNWLNFITKDGACDEGGGYWGGSAARLYHYIDIMNEATGGEFGCLDNPRFRKMYEYISRICVSDEFSVNFSDCVPRLNFSGLCFFIGTDTDIKELRDFAVFSNAANKGEEGFDNLSRSGVPHLYFKSYLLAPQFKEYADKALENAGGNFKLMMEQLREDVPKVNWYPETQHFIASAGEWTLAAKGGHNAESHNHNDIGSMSLYYAGIPILCDLGSSTYVRQTFNPAERYTIWSMRSINHSLPVINGHEQKDGRQYEAHDTAADTTALTFHTDIAGAYPSEAAVKSWTRDIALTQDGITVEDNFNLTERTAPDTEVFMARGNVRLLEPGKILIQSYRFDRSATATAVLYYPVDKLDATLDIVPITDERQINSWNDDHITRILLNSKKDVGLTGSYRIEIKGN